MEADAGTALDGAHEQSRELVQIQQQPRVWERPQSRRNSHYSVIRDELHPLTRRASMNSHTEVGQWRRWERA